MVMSLMNYEFEDVIAIPDNSSGGGVGEYVAISVLDP